MRIENLNVYGFGASLRAMRNPKDSWSLSDSTFKYFDTDKHNWNPEKFRLGEKDKILSQSLTKAGSEHFKHLRMIQVWADLTLPRYIWAEFDTYKHVEKVSCSTMHRLMSNTISVEMFEEGYDYIPDSVINEINLWIERYKETTDSERRKVYKTAAKSLLPESFLQKRTINTNYQQLLNIYNQRKNHELWQWREIRLWILGLPYFTELTGLEV